ncbi:MAG: hypothetical protein AAGF11_21835 [Myxococcota bacterium]
MPPLPRDWSAALRMRLETLLGELARHPRLGGALLFGDRVRGASGDPQTPVGLALILESMGDPADIPLAETLRMAFLSARVEPWLVVESELPQLADVFPLRLFELRRYGWHWHGRITTIDVEPDPVRLRARIEQIARTTLKRRRWFALMPDKDRRPPDFTGAAHRLRVLLAAYDHLGGGTEDGLEQRCATALGLPPERVGRALDEAEPAAIDESLTALVRSIEARRSRGT